MWTILNIVIEFVTILLLLFVVVFVVWFGFGFMASRHVGS